MSQPREYIEFYLIDPNHIKAAGTDRGARTTIVGVLIQGISRSNPQTLPRDWAAALNRVIVDMAYTVADRRRLRSRSTTTGTVVFLHCSRCGGRLTRTKCAGCDTRYTVTDETSFLGARQPLLPAKVAAYLRAQGHQFVGRRA